MLVLKKKHGIIALLAVVITAFVFVFCYFFFLSLPFSLLAAGTVLSIGFTTNLIPLKLMDFFGNKVFRKKTSALQDPVLTQTQEQRKTNSKKNNSEQEIERNQAVVNDRKKKERIGKGAFGTVTKSTRYNMEKGKEIFVAVKTVPIQANKESLEREIKIMSELKHPNIIEFYESNESPLCYQIFMQLMECDLYAAIEASKNFFSLTKTKNIMKGIFFALAYMHEKRYVHRDIKSENILITNNPASPDEPDVRLTDFGLSRKEGDCSSFAGSATWLPLEVLNQTYKNDEKTDIYSACLILLHISSREYPFGTFTDPDKLIIAKEEKLSLPRHFSVFESTFKQCQEPPEDRITAQAAATQIQALSC